MYSILRNDGHLVVKLKDDFDFPLMQTIIHHVTMLSEYPDTNDIWVLGSHHANIRLGELEAMVSEFHCRCPRDATRTKTAIVVDEGLTGSIVEIWVKGLKKRVAFDIRIFRTPEAAEAWLGVAWQQAALTRA